MPTSAGRGQNVGTTPFYKENPFWGAIGGFLAFSLTGVGFAVTGHVTLGRCLIALAWPWALMALWLATNGLTKSKKRRIIGRLVAIVLVVLLAWCSDKFAQPTKAILRFSLIKMTDHDSLALLGKPLGAGQAFYRFQMFNGNRDISSVSINLDLPALLAEQPTVIHSTGAENLTVKEELSPCMVTLNGKTERISAFDNSGIIEISQFRQPGVVDIGFVTATPRPRMLVVVTAPDGAIKIGLAPAYGRYGSLSIRYREDGDDGKNEFHSFAVRDPDIGGELIDSTKELRPGSRSILTRFSQDDFRGNDASLTITLSYFLSEFK